MCPLHFQIPLPLCRFRLLTWKDVVRLSLDLALGRLPTSGATQPAMEPAPSRSSTQNMRVTWARFAKWPSAVMHSAALPWREILAASRVLNWYLHSLQKFVIIAANWLQTVGKVLVTNFGAGCLAGRNHCQRLLGCHKQVERAVGIYSYWFVSGNVVLAGLPIHIYWIGIFSPNPFPIACHPKTQFKSPCNLCLWRYS